MRVKEDTDRETEEIEIDIYRERKIETGIER
jgi:hypothetical protein